MWTWSLNVCRTKKQLGAQPVHAGQRAAAVSTIADSAFALGWGVRGVTASVLPGPAGNVEYFLWLGHGAPALNLSDLDRAIEEGPS